MHTGLVKYDNARRALQEAHTVDEVKDIRDKAEALRLYAKQAKDIDMAVWAAEIKLRAERKAGNLIQEKQANGELASKGKPPSDELLMLQRATLSDHGINRTESARWQQEAAVPDEAFEQYIAECRQKSDMPTAAALRRLNSADRREERVADILKGNQELGTDKKYPVIYADPPWRYENPPIGASNRSIENQYPTMALEEICALPVIGLATDSAVLFMWATSPKLAECMQVIEDWGFTYRTSMVWVKDKIGMGYHVRNQHELLLIAKRGELPAPPIPARVSSVVNAPRTAHSAKPEIFYEIIEAMYPEFPKIEMFCRSPREGWAAWGNQSGG